MLAYDFFLLFGFVFWAIVLGDSFFVPFFLLVYSIVYATSLITNLGEQYSLTFVDKKKKKKAAKRWPCYSGEWKQARHGKYLSLLLDVFSVWKPWHWGIKKKWKGEERERRYFQKKKGGSKGKFEWFLCTRKKIGERQTTIWTFQGGDSLVTSSTHFPSFTKLFR